MAKARKGSRKPAVRAKGAKKSVKRTKKRGGSTSMTMRSSKQVPPDGLDLKKLQADIVKANDALTKRLQGADPERARKLMDTQSKINQWSLDINSICGATEADEPCGTTMLIS